jgi:hypothetical protein
MDKNDKITLAIALYGAVLATTGMALQISAERNEQPKLSVEYTGADLWLGSSDSKTASMFIMVLNRGFKPIAVTRLYGTVTVDTGSITRRVGRFEVYSEDVPLRIAEQDFARVKLTANVIELYELIKSHRGQSPGSRRLSVQHPSPSTTEQVQYPHGFPAVLDINVFSSQGDSIRVVRALIVGAASGSQPGMNIDPKVDPYPQLSW